ncbi:MAG TPA: LLM class flavin-dependent oxidoreductase, partial [Thermoleophilia bacterium]|nr:LLM class flavin-dependent oxidoreductase [Thermoleophilia bacterium]
MTEVWTLGVGLPGLAARQAARVEAARWDGLAVVDSQNLSGDVYIALALAAHATERLRLATGVTNPYTRHPAVTASAIATVHAESGGRAVLGIGRGDSALAHLGLAPAPVDIFERYLARVQGYLRGEEVAFDTPSTEHPGAVESLGLASRPVASRLQWLRASFSKVPVSVAATGPRVIAAAARQADRCTFAVGADPDRIRWAIAAARAARHAAGLPDEGLSFGAYLNVVAHPDREVALSLASGGVASFARFSVMHGTATGPVSDEQRDVLNRIHEVYDMNQHTFSGAPQAGQLTP